MADIPAVRVSRVSSKYDGDKREMTVVVTLNSGVEAQRYEAIAGAVVVAVIDELRKRRVYDDR